MPTRSPRRRRQAACHTPSEAGAQRRGVAEHGAHFSTTRGSTHLVEQVGEQVDEHRQHGDVDRHRLDHRVVAAVHRQQHLAAQAGNREEHLDQERADEDARQRQPDVRQDRDHRVAQHVAQQHHRLAQALGARGAHVVLADLVEEEAAVQARLRRHADHHRQQYRQWRIHRSGWSTGCRSSPAPETSRAGSRRGTARR